jgi:glycosyltransferase involved in cell wall biosynthesis
MRILLLGDPASSHIIKWANGLTEHGLEIYIWGFRKYSHLDYNEKVVIRSVQIKDRAIFQTDGSFSKIYYLRYLTNLKQVIKKISPSIIHAHYASSYGLFASLMNFHPIIISVWGSDIYNFPNKSLLHKKIIKYILGSADKILSTSNVMARYTNKFTNKEISITPFGIDIEKFKSFKSVSIFKPTDIVIGTVKSLEEKYGIEYLIRAFKIVKTKFPSLPLKLLVVGTGSQESRLKRIVKELGLSDYTVFTGYINPDKIPFYHNMIDIAVFLSIDESESFGVAALEASACEKPVIVSNVGGLPEVVEQNKTGVVVPPQNSEAAAFVLEKLIYDKDLRTSFGKLGRDRVVKNYNWTNSINNMIKIYEEVLQHLNKQSKNELYS